MTAGFATVAEAYAVMPIGKLQVVEFYRVMAQSLTRDTPTSLWNATGGDTGAGTFTSTGVGNGRVCTKSTPGVGHIPYNNAASGETQWCVAFGVKSITASAQGHIMLVDRISDCNINASQATASFTGLDATSRIGASSGLGDGAQMFTETATAGSGTNSFSLTYTNEAATGSRTSGTVATQGTQVVMRSTVFDGWTTLQAGDRAVRTVDSISHLSGTGTGTINVCLFRPIAWASIVNANEYRERDFLVQLPYPVRIYDDSCLQLLYTSTQTAAATIQGKIHLISK